MKMKHLTIYLLCAIYSGDYWDYYSYSNHSSSFADHLYYAALGEDTLEIVSWA